MKKNLPEKLASRRIRRPAPVIYPILVQVMRLLYEKKLGMRFERRVDVKSIKGPFIVVGNHASRLDYLYMAFAMKGHRLNFVAGYNEFFRSHLKFILRFMNVIPKKNFTPDMYAMREMRRIIKKGGALAIFPEGMSSISGANQPVAIGSGTFIKLMGVPVYMTRISGGYLTSTKNCLDERPGRVDVVLDTLFTAEELKTITPAQIEDRLNSELYNDDYAWNKKARAEFDGKGRIAHDMHTLLFKCPRCGREFAMKGEGDTIRCLECGNGARVNGYYDLIPFDDKCVIPETPRAWFDWEREQVRQEIQIRCRPMACAPTSADFTHSWTENSWNSIQKIRLPKNGSWPPRSFTGSAAASGRISGNEKQKIIDPSPGCGGFRHNGAFQCNNGRQLPCAFPSAWLYTCGDIPHDKFAHTASDSERSHGHDSVRCLFKNAAAADEPAHRCDP